MKRCPRCDTRKDLSNFTKDRNRKDGLKPWCKVCCASVAATPESRARRREVRKLRIEEDPNYERKWDLKRRYGMTINDYDQMFEKQNGCCAICKMPPSEGKNLFVDHDHMCCSGDVTCGLCVRALLCLQCNTAVGWVETLGSDWWNNINNFVSELEER